MANWGEESGGRLLRKRKKKSSLRHRIAVLLNSSEPVSSFRKWGWVRQIPGSLGLEYVEGLARFLDRHVGMIRS